MLLILIDFKHLYTLRNEIGTCLKLVQVLISLSLPIVAQVLCFLDVIRNIRFLLYLIPEHSKLLAKEVDKRNLITLLDLLGQVILVISEDCSFLFNYFSSAVNIRDRLELNIIYLLHEFPLFLVQLLANVIEELLDLKSVVSMLIIDITDPR